MIEKFNSRSDTVEMQLDKTELADSLRWIRSSNIRVTELIGKGRGVLATEPIPAQTLLETAPVIPMRPEDRLPLESKLYDYPFRWNHDGCPEAITLGIMSLVNHSTSPNCDLEYHFEERCISLWTIRDIAAGEELSFDYECPLWFEVK